MKIVPNMLIGIQIYLQNIDGIPNKIASKRVTIQLEVHKYRDPSNSLPVQLIIFVSHKDVQKRDIQISTPVGTIVNYSLLFNVVLGVIKTSPKGLSRCNCILDLKLMFSFMSLLPFCPDGVSGPRKALTCSNFMLPSVR